MLDFPASPSVGQKYPASPLAGIPTYTWDGEKWTTQGGSIVSATPGTLLPLMDAKPALVGVSTNFSREDHVHPVDTSRAPFDAMAYSGLQINGGMEVGQEFGGVATAIPTPGAKYFCDGWKALAAGTLVLGAGGGPGTRFAGFPCFAFIYVTTAQASMGAGDYALVQTSIEGWRIARLQWGTPNAQPITVGFWSNHHRPGIYSIVARSAAAGNRSYGTTYTHAAADVAQYNTVTIPGCTDGTWATDNTTGIIFEFALAIGSNWIVPVANAWQTGQFSAAPGQINGVAATTDVFRITGVTVHPGNEAPTAARSPFVMRPYDQELVVCKRYWSQENIYLTSYQVAAGNAYGLRVPFSVEKRVSPTITQQAQAAANFTWAGWLASTRTVGVIGGCATGVSTIDYVVNCDARL